MIKFTSSARIAFESENLDNGNMFTPDYFISGSSLTRINLAKNSRFLINTLITRGYYRDIKQIAHKYSLWTSYELKVKLSNSSIVMKLSLDFKNSKIILLNLIL